MLKSLGIALIATLITYSPATFAQHIDVGQSCSATILDIRPITEFSIVSDDGSVLYSEEFQQSDNIKGIRLAGQWLDYVSSSIYVNGDLILPREVPESCSCSIGDGTAEQVLQTALDNTVLANVLVVGDGNISCTATNIEFDFTYKNSAPSDSIQRGGNLLSVYYNLIPGTTETKDQCFAVLCPSELVGPPQVISAGTVDPMLQLNPCSNGRSDNRGSVTSRIAHILQRQVRLRCTGRRE